MYKRIISSVLVLFLTCSLITPTAFAIDTRASLQISYYETDVTAGTNGKIDCEYHIISVPQADILGAENISIYILINNHWVLSKDYDRFDAGMTINNYPTYDNTITYYGTTGMDYKVVITVFAEDADGYDSRTQTHYVTAK
ncbi:hypothetical protein RFF05_13875 [Bengtsoniella intestinalis]|uniref:hypothetical protein n=1 Tax=Bengtsoniella intestinalis TaxID=3073143 RepID=UPI00391F81EB